MVKNLPSLQTRVPKSLSVKGDTYFNELYKKQARQNGFYFDQDTKSRKGKAVSKEKKAINWIFDDEMDTAPESSPLQQPVSPIQPAPVDDEEEDSGPLDSPQPGRRMTNALHPNKMIDKVKDSGALTPKLQDDQLTMKTSVVNMSYNKE